MHPNIVFFPRHMSRPTGKPRASKSQDMMALGSCTLVEIHETWSHRCWFNSCTTFVPDCPQRLHICFPGFFFAICLCCNVQDLEPLVLLCQQGRTAEAARHQREQTVEGRSLHCKLGCVFFEEVLFGGGLQRSPKESYINQPGRFHSLPWIPS